MPKVCGQAVHSLWVQLVQLRHFSAAFVSALFCCAESPVLTHQLSNFCTHLTPTPLWFSTSVIHKFYPLSTPPITTITIK